MFPNPEIFGRTLDWYWFFQYVAIAISVLFLVGKLIRQRTFKLPAKQLALLVLALIVLGYGGGRVFAVADYFVVTGDTSNWSVLMTNFSEGGFRWYGALLFFLLFLPVLAYWYDRQKFLQVFDLLSLAFCLFTGLVKQSCLWAGDGCYGVPTNLPWGMYFPYGAAPNILPVHPTPLYDTLFHLMLFAGLLFWINRQRFSGQVGLVFFIGTALFNIGLEFLKTNPVMGLGLTLPQWCYFAILLVGIAGYLLLNGNLKFIFRQEKNTSLKTKLVTS